MENKSILKEFPVVVYGNLEKYNDVISKGRCRIFYRGLNRNGTFISDAFAEELISTVPYAPVKGIFDPVIEDFGTHGNSRDEGRIYGIVPENPNFAWEKHIDIDGIEREYACVDIYLFTGIYKEAYNIIGKPQSMELYEPSIEGEWIKIDGQDAFEFKKGCFLGLQVLGDDVEPCFEGAAFFTLCNTLNTLIEKITEYENILNASNNEGGKIMPNVNFRLSDDQKQCMIFDLLNPNYNEEGQWELNYIIHEVYDDYALIFDCKEKIYQRVYYVKDDEKDEVTLNEMKQCFIVDVTEEEKATLDALKALNGGTFEKLDVLFEQKDNEEDEEEKIDEEEVDEKEDEKEDEKFELEQKIAELNNTISTLTVERDEINNEYNLAKEALEAANESVQVLSEYKTAKETEEKIAVIDKYSLKINEDTLKKYYDSISDFTLEQLDKELAFELVNSNPSIFSLGEEGSLIPKNNHKSGIEALLDGYINK